MALFGNKESKEEKAERAELELLEKYHLQELSDPKDIASIKTIVSELAGTALAEVGIKLQMNSVESTKISYQRALIEQNFIIIRQLDRISKKLDK